MALDLPKHVSTATPLMSWALDQFFASVEDEFGIAISDEDREELTTPGEVIDFVSRHTSRNDAMDDDEHRDHVGGLIGELMAQTLGITRYREESRFIEDLHVR
jgi:hypothetical protein